MRNMKFLTLAVAFVLVLSSCSSESGGESQAWPETIVYAGMPLDGTTEVVDSFELMADVIAKELGISVELQEATSAPSVIEALASGRVQFGKRHGFGYVVPKKKYPELTLVATTQRSPDQEPGIYSFGIVPAGNTDIQSLTDLKGKSVCYSNPTALTTYIAPLHAMALLGLDGNPDTSTEVSGLFVGDGISSAYGVANQDCDAGFMADSVFNVTLPATGDLKKEDFRVFWQSEKLPSSALVFGPGLPSSLQEAIRKVILEKLNKTWLVDSGNCSDAETCRFLNRGNWGWTQVDDGFYDIIRDMCELVPSENC